jgi:hypothetical protein
VIRSLIGAVVASLATAFSGVTIYVEQVKQGLNGPCFIVRPISAGNEALTGSRARRDALFAVQYFPASKTKARDECYGVCDDLYTVLEFIPFNDGLIRGTGMIGNVVDGVLTFTVSYSVFVKSQSEIDMMKSLEIENNAR